MDLKTIIQELDKTVHGQKDAKIALAKAAHIYLLEEKIISECDDWDEIMYKNVFLTGPSGSGKTLLVRELSKLLNIPLYEFDASRFSPEGYKGGSVQDDLVHSIEKAEKTMLEDLFAIIFLDEFDKLTSSKGDHDGFKSSVQNELLKLIEDTPNILWVVAGNYPQLRYTRTNIGFGKDSKESVMVDDSLLGALEKVGVSSQLLGRMRFFATLKQHDKDDLIAILKDPNMITSTFRKFSKQLGKPIKLTNKTIEKIAERCANSDLGARILQQELNEILMRNIADIDSDVYEIELEETTEEKTSSNDDKKTSHNISFLMGQLDHVSIWQEHVENEVAYLKEELMDRKVELVDLKFENEKLDQKIKDLSNMSLWQFYKWKRDNKDDT